MGMLSDYNGSTVSVVTGVTIGECAAPPAVTQLRPPRRGARRRLTAPSHNSCNCSPTAADKPGLLAQAPDGRDQGQLRHQPNLLAQGVRRKRRGNGQVCPALHLSPIITSCKLTSRDRFLFLTRAGGFAVQGLGGALIKGIEVSPPTVSVPSATGFVCATD